jgi:hypothetical protein
MLNLALQHIATQTYQQLESLTEGKSWRWVAVGMSFLVSVAFAFPYYDTLLPGANPHPQLEQLQVQMQAPLTPVEYSLETHAAKRAFRLLVPGMAYLTGIHAPGFYLLLQHLLGLVFFYLCIRLAERLTGDKVSALLFLSAMVGIYLGKSFFWDLFGWFDGFAFFFLLLAMYVRSPWVLFLSLTAAFWTDERAILASTLVYIWWKLEALGNKTPNLVDLLKPNLRSLVIVAAWGLYLGIRLWLENSYGLSVPMGKEGAIGFQRWELFFPALFVGFEGSWLLMVPLIFWLKARQGLWLGLALLAASALVIIPALMVADMTRSLIYAFPLFFIALKALNQVAPLPQKRNYLLLTAAACLLFPNMTIISTLSWMHPVVPGIFVEHQY